MMHALQARQRGLDVIQLEREPAPRGATVRNFGLIWVSGRAGGAELDLALRARELWEQIAAKVPATGFRAHPSLTLASDGAELSLLEEAAARPDAAARGYELLDSAGARAISPALRGEFAGGLLCHRDAIVEPRLVPGALREYLLAGAGGTGRYDWRPGREAVDVAPYGVRDHTGEWHHADLVVLCTGASHTGGVPGPHLSTWEEPPVRRVRLQMLQTAPFGGTLTTSLADGDSLRYYPAYDLPGRLRLPPQAPAGAAARAQLLLVQRLDGSLTIGDTHEYDEPFAFDVTEEAYDHLRGRAERLLGTALPPTQRRWAGVYSQVTTDELYHRSQVAPGVILVTGPGWPGDDLRTCDCRGDVRMTGITVACLDMAGTTVADDGTVIAAFSAAVERFGLSPGTARYDQALDFVKATMGQSKIEVFRRILGAEDMAQQANAAFEEHYAASVRDGQIAPLPGAAETVTALRDSGVRVCLATGFSPVTRDAIVAALGWEKLADLYLSPADAGRGRPWPDLPLTALLRLGGGAVRELAVAGDTASDVESGLRAGAGLVAGVLTGTATRAELEEAGAPVILDSVAGILPLLRPPG